MPLTRFQMRSEYSLSDPELYRAPDKDDPEALLEGVAMAGLVGVLRQLGDLAEFAAEIFHDLHEQVMVTAAKGHDLMIRVQELEAVVPSLERAFLFQTDHSSFFYNPGVDWHPNFRENKNHVAYGEMPRFIMNSYEDCRGPPRLFLLDKYDIGGAGACLKRYTDPSFFKVETTRSSTDGLPNKKARKPKKRGPQWNKEDTAVVLMRSNPKLHQLFLEEPIVKTVNKPARVKLKRRLTGFPFDTKSGRSYMEKLFVTSIGDEMLRGVSRGWPLRLPTNGHSELDPDILEVRSVSPLRKSRERIKSHPHPDEAGTMQNELLYAKNDVLSDKTCQELTSYTAMDESSETDIHVDGERKQGSSVTHIPLDIISGMDDHPAEPSAVELEGKTDHHMHLKDEWTSSFFERKMSVANHENFFSQPPDSQATTSLGMYEEGSDATRNSKSLSIEVKRISVRSSFTERQDAFALEMIDKSSADEVLESSTSHDSHLSGATLNSNGHNVELLDMVSRSNDPRYSLPHSDSGEVSSEPQSKGYTSNEVASVLQYTEKGSGLIFDPSKNRSTKTQLQAKSRTLNESNSVNSPSAFIVSEYNSVSSSSQSLHEDKYDQEVVRPMKSIFLSKTCDVLHQSLDDDEERILSSNTEAGAFGDDIHQGCSVTIPSKGTEAGCDDSNTQLQVCMGERQENVSDSEGLDAVSASQDLFPCIPEVSAGKDSLESCSTHSEIESNSFHSKQIDSELLAPVVYETLHCAREIYTGQDARAVTGDNFLKSSFVSESEQSPSNGETDAILSKDFVDLDKSSSPFCSAVDTKGMPIVLGNHAIEANRDAPGFEMNEISSSADIEISRHSIRESILLPVEPAEMAENPVSRFSNSSQEVLVDDFSRPEMKHVENIPEILSSYSGYHADASFTEVKTENAVAMKDINEFSCGEANSNNLGSVESPTVLASNLGHVAENLSNHQDASSSGQSQQHCFLDIGQDSFLQRDHSDVCYANPFCLNEGTVIPERKSMPPYHLEQKTMFSSETLCPTEVLENQGNMVNDVPGYPKDASNFTPPLLEGDLITLNETPPLPPLPPFKWRMGKLPNFSVGSRQLANDGRPVPTNEEINCSKDLKSQPRSPDSESSLIHTTFHHPPELERKEQQHLSHIAGDEVVNQKKFLPREISIPDASNAASEDGCINQSSSIFEATSKNAIYLTTQGKSKESVSIVKISSSENHLVSDMRFEVGNAEQSSSVETDLDKDSGCAEAFIPAAPGDARSVTEHLKHSEDESVSETKSKEKAEQISSAVEAAALIPWPEMEIKKPSNPPDVVNEDVSEGGIAKEIPKGIRVPRSHKALVDAASALDRSKLRKVVQNDRAQAPKATERDSLLEQIRTKSFNLKPAMGSRPRIQAPRTNLKVAAILERANAIRQALTGSDEDEEESWSDS